MPRGQRGLEELALLRLPEDPASHRGFGLGYRVQNAVLAKLEKLC